MAFKYQPRPFTDFQDMMVGYEIQEIDDLLEHVEEHRSTRETRLLELAERVKCDDDRFVDDFHELMRVGELSAEFAIVALSRIVETHRAFAIRRARKLKIPPPNPRDKHWNGWSEIEELRDLNNAVKHEGKVSKDLARHAEWLGRVGEDLGDLRPVYDRIKPVVPRYLQHFASCLDGVAD